MSRATLPPPARPLALLAAVVLIAIGAVLAIGVAPAAAAKPCWERVIDDWVDNGRIDGVYSSSCLTAARRHVPEDIRTYTDIIDKIDAYNHDSVRTPEGSGGTGGSVSPMKRPDRNETTEPRVSRETEGPIEEALNTGTTDASSIPLPLIVLAGLALLLMAAGGAGFAHRKLRARKIRAG